MLQNSAKRQAPREQLMPFMPTSWLCRFRWDRELWWVLVLVYQAALAGRGGLADLGKRRESVRTLSCRNGLAHAMRAKPTLLPWPDEPRPAMWLHW